MWKPCRVCYQPVKPAPHTAPGDVRCEKHTVEVEAVEVDTPSVNAEPVEEFTPKRSRRAKAEQDA